MPLSRACTSLPPYILSRVTLLSRVTPLSRVTLGGERFMLRFAALTSLAKPIRYRNRPWYDQLRHGIRAPRERSARAAAGGFIRSGAVSPPRRGTRTTAVAFVPVFAWTN